MSYILVECIRKSKDGSPIWQTMIPMCNDEGTAVEIFKTKTEALKVLGQLESYQTPLEYPDEYPNIYGDIFSDINIYRIH